MNFERNAILLLIPVLLLAMLPVVYADFAQTTVFFTVATSTSFSVTLPGQSAVNSNGTANPNSPPTANINFSSNGNTVDGIIPCVVGGSCQSGNGAPGTPIFQYDNTGTTNVTILLVFNQTLPTGVTVEANSSWNKTSASNGTAFATAIAVNSTSPAVLGTNIDYNALSVLNVYLFANFSSVSAGVQSRLLNHTTTSS